MANSVNSSDINDAVDGVSNFIVETANFLDSGSTFLRHEQLLQTKDAFHNTFANQPVLDSAVLGVAAAAGVGYWGYTIWRRDRQIKREKFNYLQDQSDSLTESEAQKNKRLKQEKAELKALRKSKYFKTLLKKAASHPKEPGDLAAAFDEVRDLVAKKKQKALATFASVQALLKSQAEYANYTAELTDTFTDAENEADPKLKLKKFKQVFKQLENGDTTFDVKITQKPLPSKPAEVALAEGPDVLPAAVEKKSFLRRVLNSTLQGVDYLWNSTCAFLTYFWIIQWGLDLWVPNASLINIDLLSQLDPVVAVACLAVPLALAIIPGLVKLVVKGVSKLIDLVTSKKQEVEEPKETYQEKIAKLKQAAECEAVKHNVMRFQFAKTYYDQFDPTYESKPKFQYPATVPEELPEAAIRLRQSRRRNVLIAIAFVSGFLLGAAIMFGILWPVAAAGVAVGVGLQFGLAGGLGGLIGLKGVLAQVRANKADAELVESKKATLHKLKYVEDANQSLRSEIKDLKSKIAATHQNRIQDVTAKVPEEGQVNNGRFWRVLTLEKLHTGRKVGSVLREIGLKTWILSYVTRAVLGALKIGVEGLIMAPIAAATLIPWAAVKVTEYFIRKKSQSDREYVNEAEARLYAAEREHAILQNDKQALVKLKKEADVQAQAPREELRPDLQLVKTERGEMGAANQSAPMPHILVSVDMDSFAAPVALRQSARDKSPTRGHGFHDQSAKNLLSDAVVSYPELDERLKKTG